MYTEEDLVSAVEAGVLNETTASALRAHAATRRRQRSADTERIRLASGFNDLFVVIAGLLLVSAAGAIGSALSPGIGALLVTLTSWGLAEVFVRRRKMTLPGIALLFSFTGGMFFLVFGDGQLGQWVGASALAAVAAWGYWRRFHVPMSVAVASAAVTSTAISGGVYAFPSMETLVPLWSAAAGILVFVFAMRWDAADPERNGPASDVAFWLHLLAAPLIVHPVFSAVGVFEGAMNYGSALLVLLVYLVLALVSIAIDRRALMVSGLIYVLYAVASLLAEGSGSALSLALTALVIGSALLTLAAYWERSRTAVLRWVPATCRRRLAPLRG